MKYTNQCYKCNQDFEHTEIIETIAISTSEDSWEEVVFCDKCQPYKNIKYNTMQKKWEKK